MLEHLAGRSGLTDVDVNLLIGKRRAIRFRQSGARTRKKQETTDLLPLHQTLLEALCCVMVSDGKATKAERETIVDILSKVGAPLNLEQIESAIVDFVSRVKESGLREVLQRCVDDVQLRAADPATERVFRRALRILARVDGSVHEREKRVISQLVAASRAKEES